MFKFREPGLRQFPHIPDGTYWVALCSLRATIARLEHLLMVFRQRPRSSSDFAVVDFLMGVTVLELNFLDILFRVAEKNGGKLLGVVADTGVKLKKSLEVNFSDYFENTISRCA